MKSFDAELASKGLYACDKQTLWSKGLFPLIKSKGNTIQSSKPSERRYWGGKSTSDGALDLISFSEVKIRKYGESYHKDKTVDTSDRWDEKKVKRALHDLRDEYTSPEESYLIIMTFGGTPEPFRKEFIRLDETVNHEKLNIIFDERIWADPHKRGIFTRLRIYKTIEVSVL